MIKKIVQLLILILIAAFTLQAQFTQLGGKLIGTNATSDAHQGYSTDISADGSIVVQSAPFDNSQVGAVWVYTFNGINYVQLGNKLIGSGYVGTTQQGFSLSMTPDGKYLAVGGWFDNGGIGAVWIYQFNGSGYTQLGNKLVGTGIIGQAYFGTSVKFSSDGTTLVVGGAKNNNYEGATWIYTFNGTNFVQFGNKLSATGAVYGAYGPQIGRSVDISLDKKTIVVGAIWDNSNVGAAWVYTFNGSNYVQFGSKLVGTNSIQGSLGSNQGFCTKISADSKIILVSSHADNFSEGAFYVYSFDGNNYSQLGSKYVASNLSNSANFGVSLAISSDSKQLAVGANLDNNGIGAVYIYTFNGQAFVSNEVKIIGNEAISNSYFGSNVAFNENTSKLIVGGSGDGTVQGGSWIFQQPIADNSGGSGSVNLQNGLVAYYPFNGNANDESGNGNNGTVSGAILTTNRFNSLNSAYNFDGISSYIKVNNSNSLIMSNNEVSTCAWVTINGFPLNDKISPIISKGDIERDYLLSIGLLNNEYNIWGGFESYNTYTSELFNLTIPNWNFVCQTYNNTSNEASFYLNGSKVNSSQISGVIGQNQFPLLIGYDPYGNTEFAYGKIDDIRIYNRALNEAEIQALNAENQNGDAGFYSINKNSGNLVFISLEGSIKVIGDTKIPNLNEYTAMDFDVNQNLWVLVNKILYKLSILNGEILEQHPISGETVGSAISFNKENMLFVLNEVSGMSEGQLARIDLNTFINTPVSSNTTGIPSILAMDFDENDILWYLDDCCENRLGQLNTSTGISYNYALNVAYNSPSPKDLDYSNGILYGINVFDPFASSRFFSIDRATGTATQLFTLSGLYLGIAGITKQAECNLPDMVISVINNRLSTTSISGLGYQWYLNNSTIAGANSNVLADQLQIGVYNVKVTEGNCASISDPFNIGNFPAPTTVTSFNTVTVTVYKIITVDENGNTISGMNNRLGSKNISIYPNPNNGVFNIKSDNIKIAKIEIVNALGNKVFESKHKEINVTGYSNGMYLLKLFDADDKLVETRKLLIE